MQDDSSQDDKTQNLVNKMKQFSNQGLSFETAKEKLIAEGYSNEEINLATDNYQYGSKPVSDIPNQVTQYYQQHPEQAEAAAAGLVKAVRKEEIQDMRTQAIADDLASDAAPDLQSQVTYQYRFANDVGLPYWLLVGLGFIVNVIAYVIVSVLHLNGMFYIVNGVLSLILSILLIIRIR